VFAGSILVQEGDQLRATRSGLQRDLGGLHRDPALVEEIWDRALDRVGDGEVHDVHALVRDIVFEVTVRAFLGLDLGDEIGEYRRQLELLVQGAAAPFPFRLPGGRLDRALRIRDALVAQLAPRLDAPSGCPVHGLVNRLAKRPTAAADRRNAVEQLLLLFWAGYDTSAAFQSWMLHELARAPEWQERLHGEARARVGDGAASPGHELPAHDFVLKEVERLRPPVLFLPRTVEEDVEIAGAWLPRGTSLFYSPYLSHRVPDRFPRPETFDPGRWDPATSSRVPPASALVGFGGGARTCLGRSFALMHARVALLRLLRRFRLEVADPSFGVRALPMYQPERSLLRFRRR
jgi:cytochrome P450